MPYAAVGPGPLYYEIRGAAGPPVLYLLGLGSFIVAPRPFRLEDRLSAAARVLLVDIRGVGRSAPDPGGEYSIEGFAADAAAVLDAAGWDRVHVAGVSMGGMIAQAFALAFPDRTATLALLATAATGASGLQPDDETMAILENRDGLPEAEAARRAWATSYTQAFIDAHGDYLEARRREQARTALDRTVYQRHLAALRRFDAGPRLGEIRCPTAVLWGEADRIIPPANSERLAALVPGALRRAFPGLGHAFPTEAREAVAAYLCDRLWTRAPLDATVGP